MQKLLQKDILLSRYFFPLLVIKSIISSVFHQRKNQVNTFLKLIKET